MSTQPTLPPLSDEQVAKVVELLRPFVPDEAAEGGGER